MVDQILDLNQVQRGRMMKIKALFIFILIFSITVIPCSALTISSSNHSLGTNSTINNLISVANSYDDFIYSDYVALQTNDYEYYIIWGKDFVINDNIIVADNVQYIKYYREQTSGYSSTYFYNYGEAETLSVNTYDYIITSNIGYGSTSTIYDSYETNYYSLFLIVFVVAILFAIMLCNFRRSN